MHGISDETFYKRCSKYAGLEASEAKRLKAREAENAKLQKMLAEQMLDVATFKEKLISTFHSLALNAVPATQSLCRLSCGFVDTMRCQAGPPRNITS